MLPFEGHDWCLLGFVPSTVTSQDECPVVGVNIWLCPITSQPTLCLPSGTSSPDGKSLAHLGAALWCETPL